MCRERNDGCYTALTYLSAKVLEEALVALVQSLVFACIVYFPCEFTGSFGLFWYTYFQTTLIGIREPSPIRPGSEASARPLLMQCQADSGAWALVFAASEVDK